ncbi:PAAR-like domain-containing protein [Geoalkalibacter halelectricus]|uniref:PAAR-like domain-containing protein n=1 Tax=Geoalkalibacter halelectricus TaxID=2847045 RepID=UPI003D253AC1
MSDQDHTTEKPHTPTTGAQNQADGPRIPPTRPSGGGNVLINGRTAVHAGSGGVLTTVDVCRTKIGKKIVNIAYTNVARSSDAAGTAATVFINGHPVCHQKSIFAVSSGDEPGDRMGVVSGTIKGKAEFITASPNVFIEGVPAVRQGDMMVSNNGNTAPMPLMQPGAVAPPGLDLGDLDEIRGSERERRVDCGRFGGQAPLLKGETGGESGPGREHRRLARYIDGEGHAAQRYRELVIDNLDRDTQRLTLVMRDLAFRNYSPEEREFIVLPLAASVPTVPADAPRPSCIEDYPNFVIPIIPKRYAKPEPDQAQAKELRKGWLYVYRNGYLWRELEVMEHGHTRDVNLRRHQGQDERPASGEVDSRVLIPYKMGGIHQQIEIAYSEVQWSWARINALGGMDPDRLEEPRLRPATARAHLSKEETAANRRARMQDFTAELKRFIQGEDTENIQSVENCTAQIYSLHLHRSSKLPVVYLHDPLGVARNLHQEMTDAYGKYAQHLEKNAHPKVIADIAEVVVAQNPKFQQHLREQERKAFLDEFSRTEDQLAAAFKESHTRYLDYRERDTQDLPLTVRVVQQDFNTEIPSHQAALEEFEAIMATTVGVEPRGRNYLTRTLENPDSALNQVLGFSGKGTLLTSALLAAVAAPLEAMEDGFQRLSDILEIRYGLKLSLAEMSMEEWAGLYAGRSATMAATNIMPVPVGQQAISSGPAVRIKGLTVHGVNVSAWAKKVAGSGSLAGVVLALEAFNFLQVLRQIRDRDIEKYREWTTSQHFTSIFSLFSGGSATFSGLRGLQAAVLNRVGRHAEAEALRISALRIGTVAAFLGAAYDITQAYQKHQAGDSGARNSYLTSAGGSLMMGAGGLVLLKLGAKTTAAGAVNVWNPAGWALIAVGVATSVAGAVSLLWTENSPMENWLLHCYWGQKAYQGGGYVKLPDRREAHEDYREWANNPQFELESYCRLVYQFTATLSWGPEREMKSTISCHENNLPAGVTLTVDVPKGADSSRVYVHMRAKLGQDNWEDLISRDRQPFWRRREDAGRPVSLAWNFKQAGTFGYDVLPAGVEQIEATVWYDPLGDGNVIWPDISGLQLKAGKNDQQRKTV